MVEALTPSPEMTQRLLHTHPRLFGALAVGVALTIGAAQALGGSDDPSGAGAPGPLSLTAGPGEDNHVTVGLVGDSYAITDTAGIPDPPPSTCVRDSATALRCPADEVASISVVLGDGDDSFDVVGGGIPDGVPLRVSP
jgi:hypothetical protein